MLIYMENVGHCNVQDRKKAIVGKKWIRIITFIWHLKTVFVQIIFRRNFGEILTSQSFLWSWEVEIISGGEFLDFFDFS